jgi:aryl-alcohol dehydrogenase-like predicted oxidoreductase
MKYRKFGNGEQLSAIGLGCMSMSHAYGLPDDEESIATLHYALDWALTFGIPPMFMAAEKTKTW